MSLQTFLAMTNPGFTVVTYGTHHLESSGKLAGVFDDTVTGLTHALCLATASTHGKSLNSTTEIAEGPVLLFPLALVTFHNSIARLFSKASLGESRPQFHQLFLAFGLFPLSCLLIRHCLL